MDAGTVAARKPADAGRAVSLVAASVTLAGSGSALNALAIADAGQEKSLKSQLFRREGWCMWQAQW